MKKIIFLVLSFSQFIWAGPRVVGNGGNVQEPHPVSVAYLQNLLPDARLFIVSWIQALDVQLHPQTNLVFRMPRTLSIPASFKKFFETHSNEDGNIYLELDWFRPPVIEFRTQSPCDSENGHTDGSLMATEPARICISGFSMSKKLNAENAKNQLEALIVHELSHLMGATEVEAQEIQKQYLEDMRFVSKEALLNEYKTKLSAMEKFLGFAYTQLISNVDDLGLVCKNTTLFPDDRAALLKESSVTPISAFSKTALDMVDYWRGLNIVIYHYACGEIFTGPDQDNYSKQTYLKGFSTADYLKLTDWYRNIGHKNINDASLPLYIKKITTRKELVNQINWTMMELNYGNQMAKEALTTSFLVDLNENP